MKKALIMALALLAFFQIGIAFAAVNINTASAAQLAQLKGIGSVKAAAIVADRKAHGNFKTVSDLTRVSGIGPKTVSELKSEATVGTPSGAKMSKMAPAKAKAKAEQPEHGGNAPQ